MSNRPLTLVSKPSGQPALHVATPALVKPYQIFRFLSCLVDKGRLIGGCQQIAIGRARAGFGNICIYENRKHGKCEDEDAQWLVFPDL